MLNACKTLMRISISTKSHRGKMSKTNRMGKPQYAKGDNVTYTRKYGGAKGSGMIVFAYNTSNMGPHYRIEGVIPFIYEDEITGLIEDENPDPNEKPAPPYLHITKKSLSSRDTANPYDDDYMSNHTYSPYRTDNNYSEHAGMYPSEKAALTKKRFKVPVNYIVTTYVHVVAANQAEAIEKAQLIEAPQIEIWDMAAHGTKVESEVCPYDLEEIED
jgi:hypothetical protein